MQHFVQNWQTDFQNEYTKTISSTMTYIMISMVGPHSIAKIAINIPQNIVCFEFQ